MELKRVEYSKENDLIESLKENITSYKFEKNNILLIIEKEISKNHYFGPVIKVANNLDIINIQSNKELSLLLTLIDEEVLRNIRLICFELNDNSTLDKFIEIFINTKFHKIPQMFRESIFIENLNLYYYSEGYRNTEVLYIKN
ncbi:MAG: hypothetical protein ACNA7U_00980 [Candidatus Izemoplasmataceae bacterium]